ncbi:hypothetical protein IJJ39_01390 [Candidatus Saccharibacteria bacterium]|nr:hypothetical protein [Candidatus Saccharibacteria bacterium]
MKKIILKSKLENREAFEDRLSAIDLDFTPIYWQHDRIYVPRGYRPNSNYPRLTMRTNLFAVDEQPSYSLILRRHIEDSGIDIYEETPVSDYVSTVNIIFQLGFKQIAEVSRRRQELDMGEGTFIYLDSVDGREESYAKIETILKDGDSVEAVRRDLESTFKTFGEHDFINRPYFELNDQSRLPNSERIR